MKLEINNEKFWVFDHEKARPINQDLFLGSSEREEEWAISAINEKSEVVDIFYRISVPRHVAINAEFLSFGYIFLIAK